MAKTAPRGAPVTSSWSQRYRTVKGKKCLVKVRKVGGREQVRMVGVVDATDRGPRRHRRKLWTGAVLATRPIGAKRLR